MYGDISGIDVVCAIDKIVWHSVYEARSFSYLIKCSTIRTSIAMLTITARVRSVHGRRESLMRRFIYQTEYYPSGFHRASPQRKRTQCAIALIPRMPFAMLRIPGICEMSS